jgi:hypothetical protein
VEVVALAVVVRLNAVDVLDELDKISVVKKRDRDEVYILDL